MQIKRVGIIIAFVIISKLAVAQNQITKDFEYRLYPTENVFNFIKLNTTNGQLTQVQYSM